MNCKKYEISRPEMNAAGRYYGDENMRDMDYVITTKELAKWLKEEGTDFNKLQGVFYDDLLGRGSGTGQPKTSFEVTDLIRFKRIAGLYNKDSSIETKNSHNNPDIQKVYEDFYTEPLSKLAEEMLHTFYSSKEERLDKQ